MSDKHTDSQGDVLLAVVYQVPRKHSDGFLAECGESMYFQSASEGQAQTSAAIPRHATDGEIAEWAERYNISNMLGSEARAAFEDAESLHHTYAAQLADSTALGAPVGQMNNVAGNRVDVIWYGKKPPHGALLYAAPTAQQSLTAGGAVLDELKTLRRCITDIGKFVGECADDTLEILIGHDIQTISKYFAAAPLPQGLSQGTSEALDAALQKENAELRNLQSKLVGALDDARHYMSRPDVLKDETLAYIEEALQDAREFGTQADQQAIKPSVDNDLSLRSDLSLHSHGGVA